MAMAHFDSDSKSEASSGFNTPAVFLSVLAFILFVLAFGLFMRGGFLAAQASQFEATVLDTENTALNDALAEQQARLDEGYRWVNQEAGTVGMPIDAAKELLVQQHAAQK